MEAQIRSKFPNIDPVVSAYSAGYLNHAAEATSALLADADNDAAPSPLDDALAAITALLVSASGDPSPANEAATHALVKSLADSLLAASGAAQRTGGPVNRRLDQAIRVGAQRSVSSTLALATTGAVDLESAAGRKVESRVDRKKLEKAERKIRAKQDRKVMKNVEYEASRLLAAQPDEAQSYDEFYMAVNPLQLGNEGASKSKDIKVEGFDVSISGKRILSDSSLTLAYGRRYGLVGQNGIGKSTLLRALSRREVPIPTHISILHVEQEITGDDTPALQAVLDADVWRKHLLKEQEKVAKELASIEEERVKMADTSGDAARLDKQREGLDITLTDIHAKLSEMDSDRAEPRAATILHGLGFSTESQQQPTRSFSGGWRMRLALARALFCEPDLLLLDEPSNMLDVPSITFLSGYLQQYPSTVLVVSHDRAFLNEVATDIIHQHSERLDYYKGANFDSFYATREERRKTAKREYENQMAVRAHLQAFIDKFRYNAAKSSEAQSRIKKLEKMPVLQAPEAEYSVKFTFPEIEKLSPPIIQMSDVTFGYTKDKILLKHVDLDVQLDSRIGIVGPNGAGKTTALKLLIGALTPTSGLISQHPRLRIGFFAQHHVDGLDLNASAVSFLAAQFPGQTDEEYRRHLGAFGITGMTGLQKMELLSGGQKSRVAFACLSAARPHILVLDEPSNHLDIEAMDALSDALQRFQGGVLMVSHDVTMLQKVCTSLWVCDGGTVEHFDGTVNDYKRRIMAQANEAGVPPGNVDDDLDRLLQQSLNQTADSSRSASPPSPLLPASCALFRKESPCPAARLPSRPETPFPIPAPRPPNLRSAAILNRPEFDGERKPPLTPNLKAFTLSGPRDHRSGRAAPPPLPPASLLPPSLESLPLERLPPSATPSAKAAASALESSTASSEAGEEYPAAAPPSFSSLFSTQESADSAAAAVALAVASATAVSFENFTDGAAPRLDLEPPPCEHDVQEPLPAFSSLVYGPQPPLASPPAPFASAASADDAVASSSTAGPSASSVVAETKAALERDAKHGAPPSASRDIDDGEPPPPYSEGSSPLQSFTYVMASAGGPASIITQVSQSTGATLNALGSGGGSDENVTLDLRGTRFTLSRDELLTLPEFVLLSLFPNGLLPEGQMSSYEGDVYPVDYDPDSLQYMLEFFRQVAQSIPGADGGADAAHHHAEAVPIEPMHGSPRDMLQDRAGIIVLREDLDFYAIPPRRDIEQPEMLEVKRAAGRALLRQDGIFSGLRKSEEPGTTEQHLIEMLTAGGFDRDDRWGHRAGEPNKAVICSIALARLRTDIGGEPQPAHGQNAGEADNAGEGASSHPDGGGESGGGGGGGSSAAGPSAAAAAAAARDNPAIAMAQKLLLFWRKPARRCWWEGVELEDVEGVEGTLKVWIRRVWTLEMSVIGLR